ncbi:unnamed protein product [Amaranthus hypochondriacus]
MAEKWAKMKVCNCVPKKYADIKISDSRSNPGRTYYKCNLCGFFSWVNDEEIVFWNRGIGSAIAAGVKDGPSNPLPQFCSLNFLQSVKQSTEKKMNAQC